MSHYKRDAASNRDALFGGSGGGGSSSSKRGSAPRLRPQQTPSTAGGGGASRPRPSAAAAAASQQPSLVGLQSAPTPSSAADPTATPGPSSIFSSAGRSAARSNLNVLTGDAKIAKMSEAEDYRLKAKKCMTRGIFSKPDPISAANYYKRAADAYKACGENRLERLHRIASGDCQLGQDAYATAAAEYGRAAELAETSDETLPRKRQECHKLNLDAANAWAQMGEAGRAAECKARAAFGLVMGSPVQARIEPKALAAIEEAVEAFVPDPLNRKRDYRRTGTSAYADPNSPDSAEALERATALAKQNVITDSFAHETLAKVGCELLGRGHHESALYAFGAVTSSLEAEGYATISLSRAYATETIVTLAAGDVVAAKSDFQGVHLQRTSYLSSRECALAEDLIRACDSMDPEALDEARGRGGPNRGAMANLDPVVREVVGTIRVSGRARGKDAGARKAAPSSKTGAVAGEQQQQQRQAGSSVPAEPQQTKGSAILSEEELANDTDAAFDEMDGIMNSMGLGDDGGDDDDDDEIDLT